MIRKDRQVMDRELQLQILDACDVMRVAFKGDGAFPYVVPVSFGYAWDEDARADGLPTLYFHGAKIGWKAELVLADPHVCVEFDRFIRYDQLKHGVTARYQSLIGLGLVTEVTDLDEKVRGLQLLCNHCGYKGFAPAACGSLAPTRVWRIDLSDLAGKQNLRKL